MNRENLVDVGFAFLCFMVFLMLIMGGLSIYAAYDNSKSSEKTCKDLDMVVLTYSDSSIFESSHLTCWNPETKEVKIIK